MWLISVLESAWGVLQESAVFVLLGFTIAGVMHVGLARGRLVESLRGFGTRSLVAATVVGVPLPLCSCSVLPAALAMRRRGASKGATLAFLISTPETGVTSILLTYGLLGPFMAIARPVAAFLTAMVAGTVENILSQRWPESREPAAPPAGGAEGASGESCECDHDHPLHGGNASALPIAPSTEARPTFSEGFRHAFVDIFDDVAVWVLMAVLSAGLIDVLLPYDVLSTVLGNPWIAMLSLLVIAVPLYVCAEASTPIAAAFVAKGISPGAALVFLLAGPATYFGSIVILTRELGRRTVIVYLTCIVVMTLAMGAAVHGLSSQFEVVARISPAAADESFVPIWLKQAAAIAFLLLCAFSFRRKGYGGRVLAACNAVLPFRLSPRAGTALGLVIVAGAYVLSGFRSVGPDEMGVIRRFGRVVNDAAGPGLHWVGPYPIGRLDRLATGRVRQTLLGRLPPATDGTVAADERTGWMWLGDENVASVAYAVHWSVRPESLRSFLYGVRDAEQLVRVSAQAAAREQLSTQTIDTIYTTARPSAERTIAQRLQELCDRAKSGVRIESFRLLDVHAPAEAHEAFRDVASALEDRATRIDRAAADEVRVMSSARATAAAQLADAQGATAETLAIARGDAAAFTEMSAADAACRAVNRRRLMFEMWDRVLPGVRKYLRPYASDGRPLGLWLREGNEPIREQP